METSKSEVHRLVADDYRLPDLVFAPDSTCEVSIGGRVLRTATNSELARIDIYDPAPFAELGEGEQPASLFETAHFQAWLERFRGKPMLKWSVKNWDTQAAEPGAKHPGIHPGWLLARSLACLDEISINEGNGPIQYLRGEWMKPNSEGPYMSTNWEAYQTALTDPAVISLPVDQQQTAAVFLTPTGRMAASNGFNGVAQLSERENEVVVVFERSLPDAM